MIQAVINDFMAVVSPWGHYLMYKSLVWVAYRWFSNLCHGRHIFKESLIRAAMASIGWGLYLWLWSWVYPNCYQDDHRFIAVVFSIGYLLFTFMTMRHELLTFMGCSEGCWSWSRPTLHFVFVRNSWLGGGGGDDDDYRGGNSDSWNNFSKLFDLPDSNKTYYGEY